MGLCSCAEGAAVEGWGGPGSLTLSVRLGGYSLGRIGKPFNQNQRIYKGVKVCSSRGDVGTGRDLGHLKLRSAMRDGDKGWRIRMRSAEYDSFWISEQAKAQRLTKGHFGITLRTDLIYSVI